MGRSAVAVLVRYVGCISQGVGSTAWTALKVLQTLSVPQTEMPGLHRKNALVQWTIEVRVDSWSASRSLKSRPLASPASLTIYILSIVGFQS